MGTRCTAWRARWPWLAEGTAALLRGGLEPAEGLDHVWHGRAGEDEVWLFLRDDLILRVSTELTLDGDWPRRALALLEEEDGT